MDDPLIGRQLDEYRLEALLGQGGMARVYRGQDVRLRRYVAVKVIDAPFRSDSDYTARFEREAQAIAQLEHPHIVRLYRYGEVDNMLYMAMQYIEGVDLQTMLAGYEAQGELMVPDDVRRIIREICLALDYAHSKGVIHRDMKPANVMIDASGQAFIADFGLALMTELGTQGEIFGTPQYMAPEQAISSAGAVPQSDLYAVGVMLYRLFTGVLPFTATDPLEVAMWHVTESPPPPREKRPSLSPELDTFILKTLAKEPKDRYPTGEALANALDTVLTSSRSDSATTAVSSLSILDRVSLNREMLPPLPAAVTPKQTASVTAPDEAETVVAAPKAVSRSWLIGGGIALLVLLALWLGFAMTGGETQEGVPTLISAVNEEATSLPIAPVNSDVPTAVSMEAATPSLEPTATVLSELLLPSSSEVYLPLIASENRQPTSVALLPTSTPLPPPTETPSPTETVSPATDTTVPTMYQLLIATNKEDSLFVVNQSGEAFPLSLLRLGKGNKVIEGTEWGLEQLAPGECVAAWKDKGDPKPPDVNCSQVGERLIRKGPERFWKSQFDIFFAGEQVGVCNPSGTCLIEITK